MQVACIIIEVQNLLLADKKTADFFTHTCFSSLGALGTLRLTAAAVGGFFAECVDLRGISCSEWRQLEVDTLLRVVGLTAAHCSSVSVHRFSQKAVVIKLG
jgi:hypothetical protein